MDDNSLKAENVDQKNQNCEHYIHSYLCATAKSIKRLDWQLKTEIKKNKECNDEIAKLHKKIADLERKIEVMTPDYEAGELIRKKDEESRATQSRIKERDAKIDEITKSALKAVQPLMEANKLDQEKITENESVTEAAQLRMHTQEAQATKSKKKRERQKRAAQMNSKAKNLEEQFNNVVDDDHDDESE